MTHEAFRHRLEALEEARKLQDRPAQLISVGFRNGDGSPIVPAVAWTANCDFECFRHEGEDEDTFRARAHAECRAADPRPLQILIFGRHMRSRRPSYAPPSRLGMSDLFAALKLRGVAGRFKAVLPAPAASPAMVVGDAD